MSHRGSGPGRPRCVDTWRRTQPASGADERADRLAGERASEIAGFQAVDDAHAGGELCPRKQLEQDRLAWRLHAHQLGHVDFRDEARIGEAVTYFIATFVAIQGLYRHARAALRNIAFPKR